MTKEEILEGLKEVFVTVKPGMDLSKVSSEASLVYDLGVDSLSMLLLSLAIENKYGFQFDNKVRFNTVGDVIDYVAGAVK